MLKVFGTRFSLIGDTVMSLPILEYLSSKYGKYHLYFSIAKKCQQGAPLFLNQKRISEIKISDLDEDLGPDDQRIMDGCDIVFDVKPPHPRESDWYNYRNCVEETAMMAGIDPKNVYGINPDLKAYWPLNRVKNTVAIWPFAGYGRGLERSPSQEWWNSLLKPLVDKYKIIHFGTENEPNLIISENYVRKTNLTFFDQIKETLSCEACIGTDSGSMWCIGAYGVIPQLNLITNWLSGHHTNPLALAPTGKLAENIFAPGGCSNIDTKTVERFIYETVCV